MGSKMDSLKTLNATVRTGLLAALVGTIGYTAFLIYTEYTQHDRLVKDQKAQIAEANEKVRTLEEEVSTKATRIVELNEVVVEREAEIEKLATSMHLLKTDQRLARLDVIAIERDENGKALTSKLEFVELSPQGDAMSEPKRFELPGDVIYIDNWVVKFDDSYIEKGDVQRGTSLCLFRRIFSEELMPNAGFPLDEIGMRPQAYSRGGSMTEFEKELWADFWEFANDRKKAGKRGIRAANGEAVSIKVREGTSYSVSLRASGGLSIAPVNAAPGTNTPDLLQ